MRHRIPAAALVVLAVVAIPMAAYAQDATTDPADPLGVATHLASLFPLVVLISSLVLSPDHAASVKRLVPGVISVLAAAVYFLVNGWPGFGAQVVTGIGALSGLALTAYQPLSAVIDLITSGRHSLNSLAGPGIPIGPSATDRGEA